MAQCIICGKKTDTAMQYCKTCSKFHSYKYSKDKLSKVLDEYIKLEERKPTVLDLFAGCGGFSYGFMQAGYRVVGFVEKWEPAIQTFVKNHPTAKLLGKNITRIKDSTISKYKGKIDIIVGGPPCQGFSVCGKRDPKDKRNQLYKEYLRFIKIIEPKIVILENVPGILSMKDFDKDKIIHKIINDLVKLNYSVTYKILNASDYKVAQTRKRLIIIGVKQDLFPKPSKEIKTVIEAIGKPLKRNINGQLHLKPTKETVQRIKKLKQGEKLSKRYNFSRQRLYADKPSKTIPTIPIFIHPTKNRFLTPRELARLQSFPDSFRFYGTKTDMVKQIGNAVPPLMAKSLATKLKGVLKNVS